MSKYIVYAKNEKNEADVLTKEFETAMTAMNYKNLKEKQGYIVEVRKRETGVQK